MDPITAKLMSAAGAAADPVYVDDVFSTFLYDGTSSALTITNGIDLSGEGGLVWTKRRNSARSHILFDSERGTSSRLMSDSSNGAANQPYSITMNSDGYSWSGADNDVNVSGSEYCSWTFRKAPGFFDIVTYTGNGSNRTISHNLGSVPGSIWIKQTSASGQKWSVYHRATDSNPAQYELHLSENEAKAQESDVFNNTEPTSTVFTVGTNNGVNANGQSYVAYIFAHDDQSFGDAGDESIIKCGSYTPSSNPEGATTVNLGFEPQWVLIKNATISSQYSNWMVFDNMRGVFTSGEDPPLAANLSDAENSGSYTNAREYIEFTPTGFIVDPNNSQYTSLNTGGKTYIYIAIRRPHKPPEAGTDVFKPELLTSYTQTSTPGFAPDWVLQKPVRSGTNSFFVGSRLTGNGKYLQTADTSAEGSYTSWKFDAPTGKFKQSLTTGSTSGGIQHFFKRAPGFFDVVTYAGHQYRDASTNISSVPHNLGVVPEMIWIKSRTLSSSNSKWVVYHKDLGTSSFGILNDSGTPVGTNYFLGNTPTNSVFKLFAGGFSTVDTSGNDYVAYLFATLPGVSKVGSYTGTGSDLNIDCGFTNGARFVLIKRGDDPGDWYVWDTARGIVAGNDPYLRFNSSGSEVTNTDSIDPLNAGFTVTSSASGDLNASGGTYIFYAIA